MTIADDYINAITRPGGLRHEPLVLTVAERKLARRAPWNGREDDGEILFPDGSAVLWVRRAR